MAKVNFSSTNSDSSKFSSIAGRLNDVTENMRRASREICIAHARLEAYLTIADDFLTDYGSENFFNQMDAMMHAAIAELAVLKKIGGNLENASYGKQPTENLEGGAA